MSDKTIPLGYSNGLMLELEKAFYDERGRGARFRTTTVGRQYYQEKVLPRISSKEIDDICQTVERAIEEDRLVDQASHRAEDRMLRLRVAGCVHRPVEETLVGHGVEPFTCVPANLIVLALEQTLDRPVELAEIKLVEGACELLLVVFDKRPTLA
jgi:hypothetical protein